MRNAFVRRFDSYMFTKRPGFTSTNTKKEEQFTQHLCVLFFSYSCSYIHNIKLQQASSSCSSLVCWQISLRVERFASGVQSSRSKRSDRSVHGQELQARYSALSWKHETETVNGSFEIETFFLLFFLLFFCSCPLKTLEKKIYICLLIFGTSGYCELDVSFECWERTVILMVWSYLPVPLFSLWCFMVSWNANADLLSAVNNTHTHTTQWRHLSSFEERKKTAFISCLFASLFFK